MGGETSKEQMNQTLRTIGKKTDEELQKEQLDSIKITNSLIISQSNTDPNKDYKISTLLGTGGFANVYLGEEKYSGIKRAIKVIKKKPKVNISLMDESLIKTEIDVLRSLDHPNIVKIFEFYSTKDSFYLITEICNEGELYKEIKQNAPFNEKYCSYVMYQIFSAINYLHKMNIIHRDLKPENILIVKKDKKNFPYIKICDFGTSKIFSKNSIQNQLVGSSYYIAPEILNGKNYNEKCDIWSCGVILYILLSGRPPFTGNNELAIVNSIISGKYDLNQSPFHMVSDDAKDLIKNCLNFDHKKRFSADQCLNHNWIKGFKSKELFNQLKNFSLVKKFMDNLKNYKSDSIIQETALAYLVHNFPQINDVVNACKLFNILDSNNDGKITREELLVGLKKIYKDENIVQKDVDIIFKNIDMDGNNFIEYEEFVRGAVNKEKFLTENILRFAFRYFDKNNSGFIDYEKLKNIFGSRIKDQNKIKSQLTLMIKEVDSNGDGKISFEEFTTIMKKLLKRNK